MSIALLLMIKDEFTAVNNIIKAVEGICDEKVIVITGDKRVKESGNCKILYFPWHNEYSTPLVNPPIVTVVSNVFPVRITGCVSEPVGV